jgi:Tfp pilus assembly PilM family ATPase
VLVGGGAILFTTTIGVGGQAMELAIAQGLGVDAAEAARIKKETGLSRADYEGRLASVLMPLLAPVAAELVRTVAYYRDHGRQIASGGGGGDMVENIVLSGGDAGLYGLDTYLASETQIPVVRADPFAAIRECMDGTVPLMPYHQALAFTAAIGLALRGRACARPRTG